MQSRQRALGILSQVRELLADRMAERILETGNDLLDDAAGESYRGEIEALYEQLGTKLGLVNQLIANFPVESSGSATVPLADDLHDEDHPSAGPESGEIILTELGASNGDALPALPAPRERATPRDSALETMLADARVQVAASPSDQTTFAVFVRQIRSRSLFSASESLATLLNLPLQRAELCASHFMRRLDEDPNFLTDAMKIRTAMSAGSDNDVLLLLWECFGLQGEDALFAYEELRRRAVAGPNLA